MSRYIWSLVAHIVGAVCRPSSFDNFGFGLTNISTITRKFIWLVSQRFAGLSGNLEMQYILKKKAIRSPTEIICLASSLLVYWAGLQKDEGTKQAL
jgi:hypothetical protein